MFTSEEAAVCRKRARVRGGQNQVTAVFGHQFLFFDGKTAPKQKYQVFAGFRKSLNDGIGKLLPTDSGVACGHVGANRERGVPK